MITDYSHQAERWHRDEPKHDTDFVGRPEVLEIVREIGQGKTILDLGCGEGYFSRKMAGMAKKVIGVDVSEEMIQQGSTPNDELVRQIMHEKPDVVGFSTLTFAGGKTK